jgi:hypothetical protein
VKRVVYCWITVLSLIGLRLDLRAQRKSADHPFQRKYQYHPFDLRHRCDGMVSGAVLRDFLEFTKGEPGVERKLALRDIVDHSFVRQVGKEIREGNR